MVVRFYISLIPAPIPRKRFNARACKRSKAT